MTDAGDRIPHGPYERGLTREELLRRAAVGGIALTGVGALGAACGGDDDGTATGTGGTETTGEAKRGGTFRVGVPGGGATDLLDGQHIVTEPDIARLVATFEGLSYFDDDYKPKVDGLAEEIEAAGNADVWTIRLRSGVEFHNGKTLTADDLVYSIQRMLNTDLGLFGAAGFAAVDPNGIEKMDDRTVRLTLKRPDSNLLDSFSQYFQGIVPEGYSPNGIGEGELRWVGTGAFKVESFDPGRQSVHVRNENYWREGQPYFDEVVIIDFPDDRARVNALLGGQVDAIVDLPLAQAPVVEGRSELTVYEAPSGGWLPITMRVDQDPFKDVRVREAFRLLADREQMVAQALGGHGVIGNDIYSPYDPCYAGDDFPQREPDVEQAKSLLSAAGQENLTIDLYTTPGAAGMVEAAQVFAQNAKAGGVTVNVKNTPSATFYGDQYLQWTFAMDFWGTRNYLSQVGLSALPDATYNETHFNNPEFNKLYEEALATVDEAQRCELIREMQQIEYDEGGHIVWGFYNIVDAHSAKVAGFKQDGGNLSLNKYGNNFRTIYFV
jgi:peptide/nickel transport system substrate-binding protein